MFFEKKIVILTGDGVTKGTLKTERGIRGLTASLAVFGLERGSYALAVLCGDKTQYYPFPPVPPYTFLLSGDTDVSSAHFAVCRAGYGTVMYGTLAKKRLNKCNFPKWSGNETNSENESYASSQTKAERDEPVEPKKNDEESDELEPDEKTISENTPQGGYDDEAIAEENYFDAQPDVELPIGSAYVPDAEEKEATVVEGRKMTFYERNKEAIDGLFERGEREKTLEELLPKTKWVKLSYDEGRHYVVGVIGEAPDYICYGLPAIYSATPPVGLGGYTQWLPLDVKSPHGRGYWVLYQSAVSGETVRRKPL